MWEVILYTTEEGKNPVGDFTTSLSKKDLEIAITRMNDYLKRKGDF